MKRDILLLMLAVIRGASMVLAGLALVFPQVTVAVQQSPELDVEPIVIDDKGQPRDILKKSIKVVNTSERKLSIYPSVNDLSPEEGEQEFVSAQSGDDRAASLAQWIELSRGVIELGPGEEKEIPFVIRINLNAIPGTYHATISFYEGSNRSDAEVLPPKGEVAVNLDVQADVKEVLQLNAFKAGNFFLSGDDILFNYNLENIGNQELAPRGEIRIYNRKGEEVASVPVNEEGKVVSPDQLSQLASVWSAAEGFGRFKAFLSVDYGRSQTASVQDTIYFWIIPWKQLVALLTGSVIMVVLFALYFHRWFERRHHAALALAGVHPGISHQVPELSSPASNHVSEDSYMRTWTWALYSKLASGIKRLKVRVIRSNARAKRGQQEEVTTHPHHDRERPLREVLPQETSAHASESTINLKHLRPAEIQPGESHTIDLKKRS